MKRLEGKVGIVTGAASGIGKAVAELYAAEGASVGVADINEAAAREVAAGIEASGGQAIPVVVDVGDPAQVEQMVKTTVAAYGGLDVLHNNAAITTASFVTRDVMVAYTDLEIWDRTFQIDLRGYLLGCKYAIPEMIKRGGGSIVQTSSQRARFGDLTQTALGIAKAGVDALTKYVATQYGKQGVRCNSLVVTGIVHDAVKDANLGSDAGLALRTRHVLTTRLGTPQDVANASLFLASDESSYITGHLMNVDGGWSAHTPRFGDEWEERSRKA